MVLGQSRPEAGPHLKAAQTQLVMAERLPAKASNTYTGCAGPGQVSQPVQRACCGTAVLLAAALVACDPAGAAAHAEPANALSLPTWAIHVSSVVEWTTAMALMWRYAEVTGDVHMQY